MITVLDAIFEAFGMKPVQPAPPVVEKGKDIAVSTVSLSPEFRRARSEVESLRCQLRAKEKAAYGIFLADNLSVPVPNNYDDLDFHLFHQGL